MYIVYMESAVSLIVRLRFCMYSTCIYVCACSLCIERVECILQIFIGDYSALFMPTTHKQKN